MLHPTVGYRAENKRAGGCAHHRTEAFRIVERAYLSFQRPGMGTQVLAHVMEYLAATIND